VEIELLGQTVNAYRDPETKADFADLLRAVGSIEGLRRLRFVTSHPRDFSETLVRAMAETPAVCPALHLPVQSGSDAVLRRMKRQYTRAEYLRLVRQLRAAVPRIALSTDLIVGFPGESSAHFDETLSLLDEVGFAQHFAFTYSARPGTAAARWASDVTPAAASRRLATLFERQLEIQRALNRELEGYVLEVLVEGLDKHGRRSAGRSRCNRVVNLEGETSLPVGTTVFARIERGLPNSLVGRVVGVEARPAAVLPRRSSNSMSHATY